MSTIEATSSRSRSLPHLRLLLNRVPALTLATVGVVLLAALIVAQSAHGFTDPDYWWHFKAGEYIILHHALPHVDIFTWTSAGAPWVAHEWLSEALIFALVHTWGYGAALVVFTLSPVISVLLLYRLLRKEGVAASAALGVMALASLMIAIYSTVRPQVLSWLCFAILLSALYAYRAGRIRNLWGLPVLFAIWANLHLSFLIGLGIVALFAGTQVAEGWLRTRHTRLGQSLAIFGLCVVATCCNPQGPRLLTYPLGYLPLQKTLLPALAEWKTPDFHSYLFFPLLAAILLLLVTGLSPQRLDLWSIGLGVAVTALALQSTRYVPVFAVAFAPLVGTALAQRWSWARSESSTPPTGERSALHWCLLLAALATIAIALRPAPWSEFQRAPRTEGQLVPVHAVDVIEQQYPNARIFNQYEWGGYLTYRLWPHQRPFIDGRGEMFDAAFLQTYLETFEAQRGWQDTLQRYGVNLVIVRTDSSIAGALQASPQWRLASEDDIATVYVRD
jgi:hypothetical protein